MNCKLYTFCTNYNKKIEPKIRYPKENIVVILAILKIIIGKKQDGKEIVNKILAGEKVKSMPEWLKELFNKNYE